MQKADELNISVRDHPIFLDTLNAEVENHHQIS